MRALFLKVAWAFLALLDISVNRIFNGRVETISSRAGRSRDNGKAWGVALCSALDEIDPGHCDRAIKNPLGPLG